MFALVKTFAALLLILPVVLGSPALAPRQNTADFYLVATSSDANYNLKPLRISGIDASLTTGTPAKFYLDGQNLRVHGTSDPYPPYTWIGFGVAAFGCSVDGPVNIFAGSSSNKCARASPFALTSYDQNAQLGARAIWNWDWTGSFFACSGGSVRYSTTSTLSGCTPIKLWTVPAVA
ncbi:hypothetical protein FRC02_003095 [Tulasnella sp. 418]|nr:hypothetical protein FRC02_003095 [Tulasnella sp. 418]